MKLRSLTLATALLAIVLTNATAQSFITNGLVAYYPFNGNANDASGNGNNGTVNGATLTQDRFGNANSAYSFNGTSSYIGFTNVPTTQVDNWTVTAWALPVSLSQIGIAVSMGYDDGSTGNGYSLGIMQTSSQPGPGNSLEGLFGGLGTLTGGFTFTNTNQWHQVVMLRNSGVTTFYVDGAPTPVNGNGATPLTPTGFRIGGENGIRFFNGAINDVRIYNRALSTSEVASLYSFELSNFSITTNPTNTSVLLGSSTNLTVSVTSSSPITYQWYFNPANNSGQAGGYALTIGGFVYGAVVTNGGFGYGNVPAVGFVGGGGNGAAGYGTTSNGILTGITVTNAGSGYSSLPGLVIDPPNGLLYGQTNNTLNIVNANNNSLGSYFVVASSGTYSITSSVVSLNILYPPSIVEQPQDVYTSAYDNAEFSVTASGTPPFIYNWQFNNSNLTNESGSNLSSAVIVSNITPSNFGGYSVIVNQRRPRRAWTLSEGYGFPKESSPRWENEFKDWAVLSVL